MGNGTAYTNPNLYTKEIQLKNMPNKYNIKILG